MACYAGWFRLIYERPLAADGGALGVFAYSTQLLAGALLYDWYTTLSLTPMHSQTQHFCNTHNQRRYLEYVLCGSVLMLWGYSLACLPKGPWCYAAKKVEVECPIVSSPQDLLAPLPFTHTTSPTTLTPSAGESDGVVSVLSLSKEVAATTSFQIFSAGYGMVLYLVCHVVGDVLRLRVSVLEEFSQQALSAFLVHVALLFFFRWLVPSNAPIWWAWGWFILYCWANWQAVCWLRANNIQLRL